MEDEHAYAMLAILEGPIHSQLRTLIWIRGTTHSQVVHIQFNPHSCSIIGRTYHHHMFTAPCTQDLAPHIILPKYDNEKGLIGRRVDKIMWAITLLHNVNILEVYEEAMRQTEEDLQQTTNQQEQANTW
jgi:hypothetical protein